MKTTPKIKYHLGIDLGTSHSVLAYVAAGQSEIQTLPIEQISSPNQRVQHMTLPSALYIPHENELKSETVTLPWEDQASSPLRICGEWAKTRAYEVPEQVVTSAKSWLSQRGVDKLSPILPWQADIAGKVSPFAASVFYLQHLKNAFLYHRRQAGENLSCEECQLTLTVPASFDESARQLTHQAAKEAGFTHVNLLEEPQAAFYAWIKQDEKQWKKQVQAGDVVLVCDIGGGTTDLSLIAVMEEAGELRLERIFVGEHLLLGGDNMDLTLAHILKAEIESSGRPLSHWQFQSLMNSVRQGKELLFRDPQRDDVPIAIAGKGSSLMASTLQTRLTRTQLTTHILEGFFPDCELEDAPPASGPKMGFAEMGLHYESEPGISKHLARFLKKARKNVESLQSRHKYLRDKISPKALCEKVISYQRPSSAMGVFIMHRKSKTAFSKSSAIGAMKHHPASSRKPLGFVCGIRCSLSWQKSARRQGIRIAAGTARSYYLGIEASAMAVPGMLPKIKGYCIIPQGTEEGTEIPATEKNFHLLTGQPVTFRFFSSTVRAGDQVGTMVNDAIAELEENPSLTTTLHAQSQDEEQTWVAVELAAKVTDVGTLQLFMLDKKSEHKWNLEFDVRQ